MNIAQALDHSGVFASMANELGIDEQTARAGAGALLPAIVAGLGRSHTAPAGSNGGGLGELLGGMAGGGPAAAAGGGLGGVLLDQVLGRDPTPAQPGNDILGQIFGSKDVSRGVAEEVAGSTGISPGVLKKMLPILAMAVVGYMMKQNPGPAGGDRPAGGLPGGPLGGILGQIATGMLRR